MANVRNEALRTQLLECAIRHFSQKGYVATNMLEIAEEVGVTRGPLYYYFSNKADLYIAAAQYAIDDMKQRYTQILLPERPARDLLRDDFEYCLRNKDNFFSRMMDAKGVPDISTLWNDFSSWLIQRKYEVFEAAKARGELKPDCDIAELITFIYTFYHGINRVTSMAVHLDGFSPKMLEAPTAYFMQFVSERYLA